MKIVFGRLALEDWARYLPVTLIEKKYLKKEAQRFLESFTGTYVIKDANAVYAIFLDVTDLRLKADNVISLEEVDFEHLSDEVQKCVRRSKTASFQMCPGQKSKIIHAPKKERV